jgi:hypothetical protein
MLVINQPEAFSQASIPVQAGQLLAVDKKITIVAIPGLSFLELVPGESQQEEAVNGRMPYLEELKRRSAWGALNIRTPGKGMEDVYASMGAGQFADAASGIAGMQKGERIGEESASQRFQRFTGTARAVNEDIVIPQIEVVKRMNASNYYHARPGQLGELLAAAGIHTSVWGNIDLVKAEGSVKEAGIGKTYRRYAPIMLMNEAGQVNKGDVSGSGLLIDGSRPFGLRTNYGWLMKRWQEQASPALVLLELGDLQRLYDERESYSKEAFLKLKQEILTELDRFTGELVRAMEMEPGADNKEELWLLSPQVNGEAAKEKALLAPVMMYSPSGGEGLLASGTTRRPGLISVIDIAPTLLQAYGIKIPEDMIGLPVMKQPVSNAFPTLSVNLQHMKQVYRQRPKILYGLAVYEIIVMLGALAVVWFLTGPRALGKRVLAVWRSLLFSILIAPAGLLMMGWLPNQTGGAAETTAVTGGVLAVSIGFAAAAARMRKGFVYSLAGIGLLVTGLILYDGFRGAEAMQRSVLGYDPMIGARYYGIGNEFMGVLLGAALLGLTALQQALRLWRRPRRAGSEPSGSFPASGASAPSPAAPMAAAAMAAPAGFAAWRLLPLGAPALWQRAGAPAAPLRAASSTAAARMRAALPAAAAGALVAGYLAAPALGTNAGGALAAAAGFGALTARLAGGRRWLRMAPALALLLAAALAGLWLLNPSAATGLPADKQSHIGRAFEAMFQGRLDTIGAMIKRKLAMNWHLIGVSAWSKVLLTSLAVMAALVLRPRGLFRRWQRRYPYLMYGCAANVIGTIAALLLNDSGIVAAATMIIYGSVPLLLLKLESA